MTDDKREEEMTTREKLQRRNESDNRTEVRWRLMVERARRQQELETLRIAKLIDDLREGSVVTLDDLDA